MPQPDAPNAAVVFEGSNPIFRVRSLAASVDYYVKILGFKRASPGLQLPRVGGCAVETPGRKSTIHDAGL